MPQTTDKISIAVELDPIEFDLQHVLLVDGIAELKRIAQKLPELDDAPDGLEEVVDAFRFYVDGDGPALYHSIGRWLYFRPFPN